MTMIDDPTAAELGDEVRLGSVAAMGLLFERHAEAIYNYCFRRCASWDVAEDLTSVVFLEAWRCRSRLVVHHESALPWLYGIATNVCRNQSRSQRRYRHVLARLPAAEASDDHADDVVARLDDEQTMREILDRLAGLSPRDRDVLALVVWEEMDHASVAATLGIPVGTVKSRMSRVRRQLRLPSASEPEKEQR